MLRSRWAISARNRRRRPVPDLRADPELASIRLLTRGDL
jgi:hypothetical protein